MHIKTRLDLMMDALTTSNAALRYVTKDIERDKDHVSVTTMDRIDVALRKIEKAFEAVNGTEERPGT